MAADARDPVFSARYDRALHVAAVAHATAVRKGTVLPYISHPVHVARLLEREGCSEALILSGLLHDVLEDLDERDVETRTRFRSHFRDLATAPEDFEGFRASLAAFIEAQFGAEVLRLVAAVTEQKVRDGRERPWSDRKNEQIEHLRSAGEGVVLLKVADALHNASSVLADVRTHGLSVFARFNAPPRDVIWWYQTIAEVAEATLPAERRTIAHELADVVEGLRHEAESAGVK